MSESEGGRRRYSEEEVGLILRRATEIQRAEPTAPDPEGLTLAELEEIASEAGIDPALLRRAATELHSLRPATAASRLAGAPLEIEIERVVEGEVPRDCLEELVPSIVAATPGRGTASAVGRSLTWSSQEGSSLISRFSIRVYFGIAGMATHDSSGASSGAEVSYRSRTHSIFSSAKVPQARIRSLPSWRSRACRRLN